MIVFYRVTTRRKIENYETIHTISTVNFPAFLNYLGYHDLIYGGKVIYRRNINQHSLHSKTIRQVRTNGLRRISINDIFN